MKDTIVDALFPRANEGSFAFAFNDIDFSDRVLRLEISSSEFDSGSEVKTLHISSPILASKSPFFYKLFKDGMRESQRKNDVTLRIHASEKAALIDLLKFIYGNTLSATSAADLLDVFMIADKFKVTSCKRHCIQLLFKLPMSLESALLYLELPSGTVSVREVVQLLIYEARKFLASRYKYFTESLENMEMEMLNLPLSAVEVVLGSDGLTVNSEDDVFDFIMEWSCFNYSKMEERREILTKLLSSFIHFPYMSCSKLMEAVDCSDFDYEQVLKLMLKALLSEDKVPYGQHVTNVSRDQAITKCGFPRRVYNHRFIKVVGVELPRPSCVVYLDLNKEECADLLQSQVIYSQEFLVGGHYFFLKAECGKEPYFGLYVQIIGSEFCKLAIEFAVMENLSLEFESCYTSNCTLTDSRNSYGSPDLFEIPLMDVVSDKSIYLIDGILHLRAQITIHD